MCFISVTDIPSPRGATIVVRYRLFDGGILRLSSIESVSIFILCTPNLARSAGRIDLEYGVLLPVNLRVKAKTKQMLMIMCINTRMHLCSPAIRIFARRHGICVQNTSEFDL